jgi:putative heme-binding domain-containing protein
VNPDGTGLKVLGHNFRNSYEVIPDSYGNLWQNDNDDQVVTCRTTWLMEGGNAGYFSTDGTRYWQADQRPGQDIFRAHWHQDDPGVMPAGDRSGAGAPTGIVLNEGNALGGAYMGMLLSADAGRNVIFGYHPRLQQSGYDLGQRINLITSLEEDNAGYVWNDSAQNESTEKWFRPSDVTIGTDGAIYIADWYDPVVGGHHMKDPKGYGRIYRIAPKNKKLLAPKLDLNSTEGQVQALKSPAINVRNLGFQKLKQQGDSARLVVTALLKDGNPYIRARAVWLLAQLGEGGKKEVEALLNTPDVQVRAAAYRALRQTTPDILPYAEKLVTDTAAFIRREVAVSLGDLPYEKTKNLLLQLVKQFDGEDRWYLETLGANLHGHEADIYPAVVQFFGQGRPATQWNKQMMWLAWRLHPSEAAKDFKLRAGDANLSLDQRQASLTALAFINTKAAANAMVDLSKSNLQDVSEMAAYWLSFRQSNEWYKLLNWSKIALNTSYERKLAQMKVKRQIVLDEHQSLDERKSRLEEMAVDSVGGQMLIGLVEAQILPKYLYNFVKEKIFTNPDATVRMQARQYFKQQSAHKAYSIQNILQLKADAVKGKVVFTSRCAGCHRFGSEGTAIGPDLTTIGKKFDDTELLDQIINPSSAIVFGYEAWLVSTSDGTTIYGFLLSENKQSIVIKDISGQKHVIDVNKITSRKKQEKSIMPDPISNGLTEKDLADIVSFLKQ